MRERAAASGAVNHADLVFRHCRQLITCSGAAPRCGVEQGRLEIIPDGALATSGDHVVFAGASTDLGRAIAISDKTHVIDASDLSIVPGFVDAHTHALFAGDR